MRSFPKTIAIFALSIAAACADDIDPADENNDLTAQTERVVSAQRDGGVTETTIDSSSQVDWIYVDFATGTEVTESDGWDIAFQRMNVRVNGALAVQATTLAELQRAPDDGYLTDTDTTAMVQLGDWYEYNMATHILTPWPRVFVVRNSDGDYFKLAFETYYDAAGSSGHPRIIWAPVEAPSNPVPDGSFRVDATAGGTVYVSLASRTSSGDAASNWDIAITSFVFATHSGSTVVGGFGGARVSSTAYEALTETDTIGFSVDAMQPIPGPPGSGEVSGNPALDAWYSYNPTTHVATTLGLTYVVRGRDGAYYALKITDYANDVYALATKPLTRAPLVHTSTIDASSTEAWAYFSVRNGELATVVDAGVETTWDIALQRTLIATNSGASGSGAGGALETTSATLAEVVTVPTDAPVVDGDVVLQTMEGPVTVVASPVLAFWYDYNQTTHVVSPLAKTYVLAAADGSVAKLKITSYDSGVYTIDWVYAGPGATEF